MIDLLFIFIIFVLSFIITFAVFESAPIYAKMFGWGGWVLFWLGSVLEVRAVSLASVLIWGVGCFIADKHQEKRAGQYKEQQRKEQQQQKEERYRKQQQEELNLAYAILEALRNDSQYGCVIPNNVGVRVVGLKIICEGKQREVIGRPSNGGTYVRSILADRERSIDVE